MEVSQLYVYPIKSLRPTPLTKAVVTRQGFPYDRHFMLLKVRRKEDGTETLQPMQVPRFPEMSLFLTALQLPTEDQAGKIIVTYRPPGSNGDDDSQIKTLEVPLQPDTQSLKKLDIVLHSSPTEGYDMGSYYNDWFSDCFGYPVVLAYLGGNSRKVLGSFSPSLSSSHRKQQTQYPLISTRSLLIILSMTLLLNLVGFTHLFDNAMRALVSGVSIPLLFSIALWGWQFKLRSILSFSPWANTQDDEERITFADCAAYLVVSETSLHNVSARIAGDEEMDITKFRPNIVIAGAETAFEEDFWAELTVGKNQVRLLLTANCLRCQSINVDFATGKMGTGDSGSVLKKLMKDRRVDAGAKYSPVFGRYSFLAQDSDHESIQVGDEVVLSKIASKRTVFDWPSLS
ncbi:MOSC domain protein [Aspergillus sclerotialis]|uniref:MOSC domain protein n=1 Tax=Aspergillus sclerotialis TaxID=2070753 RepID=A0A3A2ZIV5_9EURO|nr:MOSC domain protein [Aspergillus sclerotialis]